MGALEELLAAVDASVVEWTRAQRAWVMGDSRREACFAQASKLSAAADRVRASENQDTDRIVWLANSGEIDGFDGVDLHEQALDSLSDAMESQWREAEVDDGAAVSRAYANALRFAIDKARQAEADRDL